MRIYEVLRRTQYTEWCSPLQFPVCCQQPVEALTAEWIWSAPQPPQTDQQWLTGNTAEDEWWGQRDVGPQRAGLALPHSPENKIKNDTNLGDKSLHKGELCQLCWIKLNSIPSSSSGDDLEGRAMKADPDNMSGPWTMSAWTVSYRG